MSNPEWNAQKWGCKCSVKSPCAYHSQHPEGAPELARTPDPHALLRDKLRELAERWATSASENHQLAMQGYPSDRESYAEIYRDCARELSALIGDAK